MLIDTTRKNNNNKKKKKRKQKRPGLTGCGASLIEFSTCSEILVNSYGKLDRQSAETVLIYSVVRGIK